ncbi:hypothetical protein [Paraburkholderia bannensis]|uniref:hypothetical protein n=1 Tax=Paraburkholderia bannensis TaxID=765414 RepID=UPI002AC31883|nr:hypothetical protein [Paraburkholderia bannensis]
MSNSGVPLTQDWIAKFAWDLQQTMQTAKPAIFIERVWSVWRDISPALLFIATEDVAGSSIALNNIIAAAWFRLYAWDPRDLIDQ